VRDEALEPPWFDLGGRSFRMTAHAWGRMAPRQITLEQIINAMTHGEAFRYYHSETRVFVGAVGDLVVTVTKGRL
jgi:hypothetical protein